jgi:hypothetical protein
MPLTIKFGYQGNGIISVATALGNESKEPSRENCHKFKEGKPNKMVIYAGNQKPGRLAVLFTHKFCYIAIESPKRFAVSVTCSFPNAEEELQ